MQLSNVFPVQGEVPHQCNHHIHVYEKFQGSTSLAATGHGGHTRTQLFSQYMRIPVIFLFYA